MEVVPSSLFLLVVILTSTLTPSVPLGGAIDLTHAFSPALTVVWPDSSRFNMNVLHDGWLEEGGSGRHER